MDDDGSPSMLARFSAIGCHSSALSGVRVGTPRMGSSGTNDVSAVVESCGAAWAKTCVMGSVTNDTAMRMGTAAFILGLEFLTLAARTVGRTTARPRELSG